MVILTNNVRLKTNQKIMGFETVRKIWIELYKLFDVKP